MLKRLFKWRMSDKRLTVERCLRKLFTHHEFHALLAQSPDRRDLVENAALRLGAGEESVVATLGEMMKVPVVWNILPVSFHDLNGSPSLETFRQASAYPVATNGRVVGIVASDPLVAIQALGLNAGVIVYLSSWRRIREALNQSEIELEILREKRKGEERTRLLRMAETVVGIIIEEAESHGAEGFRVTFNEREIEYAFSTSERRVAKGSIDSRIRCSLEEALRSSVEREENSFRLSDEGYRHNVGVTIASDMPLTFELKLSQSKCSDRKEFSNLIPFPGDSTLRLAEKSQEGTFNHSVKPPPRVLLIEDNETFAKVLNRFFERYKIDSDWVQDGEAAYSKLINSSILPGAIVCDVHMPGMNGFELLSKLRSTVHLKHIPIIMLTSDQDIETELSLLSNGADVFIGKTEDPRLLCVHVRRLLDKTGNKEAA